MINNKYQPFEFTMLHKEIVSLINSGYTTEEIEAKLSIKKRNLIKDYYRLLINSKQFLSNGEYQSLLSEYLKSCSFKTFFEEKIVLISDTHLASKHENLEYLKQVKDFLLENEIKYLIHGGDIGDGMVEYTKEYSSYSKQLEHLLEVYDFGETIKQFILGGNHDAKYKKKNSDYDILNILEENNPNITAVGYYQAYFKLGCNVISLEHNSYYNKSFIGRDFSLLGHSHYLAYKPSAVILPTLSDSFPNSYHLKEPGFLVLDNKIKDGHTKIEFTNYKTTPNGLEKGKTKSYSLR